MKKLLLSLFGIIILGLINFSSATDYSCSDSFFTINEDSYFIINYEIGRSGSIEILNPETGKVYCYTNTNGFNIDNSCVPINSFPLIITSGMWEIDCRNITSSSFSVVPAITSCPTCPTCDDWTQLQCESEYNLIPESSINSEYCEENFNLIDPENCPASSGTGDVNWSSFFVNSHQIQGASNIYLRLPDFLSWDYTYIDSGSTLEIDVENEGDQEYIQSILDIQSYHPDKDQFAQSFAGFLTLLMPYIIITLFIIFIWRLIKRIFR